MICPSCKKKYDDNQIPNFCGHCGISLGSIRINTSADIMDKLKGIYEEIGGFCRQLEETNKQLLAQNQEIVSLADALKIENEDLRKENDKFAQENGQLREECDKVHQDNADLHEEANFLREEARVLRNENEKLREDFALLKKTAADMIENNLSDNIDQHEPDHRKISEQNAVSGDVRSTESKSEQSTANFMGESETQIGFDHSVPDPVVTKDNSSDVVYEKFVPEEKTKLFIAFLNGERNLPEGFNKLTVFEIGSETGYIVYIYGPADTTGSINVYPGQEFRMAEAGSFYDSMFEGRSEKEADSYAARNILSIAPCELERTSNGYVMPDKKGFVEFEPLDREEFVATDMTADENLHSDTILLDDELYEEEQFEETEDISSNFLKFFNNYKGAELPKRFKEIKIKADEKFIKLDEKTGSLFYADGLNAPGGQILLYPRKEAKKRLTKTKNSIFFEIKTINFSFNDVAEADYAAEIEPCVAVNEHGSIRIINKGKIVLGCGKIDINGTAASSISNANNGTDKTAHNGSQRSNSQSTQSVNYSSSVKKYNTHNYVYDVMPSETLTASNHPDSPTFADTAKKLDTASAEKAPVNDTPAVLPANNFVNEDIMPDAKVKTTVAPTTAKNTVKTASDSMSDDDEYIEFFNSKNIKLPPKFIKILLGMNDGEVRENASGYLCYIIEDDKDGKVKIYPGRNIKVSGFMRYYKAAFDCIDFIEGTKIISGILPCKAVRNSDGSYDILKKGIVKF